jgi:hypothetical protein
MAFTRFHDDPARIRKYVAETSFAGRYYMNVPGIGINMPFQEDPQIRAQKWGANLTTNTLNLESDLRGLTRKYNNDEINANDYKANAVKTHPFMYKSAQPIVLESRASHPAWTYKDLDQTRWETPFLNPQVNTENKIQSGLQTRILEKDTSVPIVPVFSYLGQTM